jgi:transglutaminase-like putative cysteine protease
MSAIRIRHITTYRFTQPVRLSPHRLMLRPRESRELRLMSHLLAMTPTPVVTWAQDVFGNAVATASFAVADSLLVVDSTCDILLDAADWPVFDIAASAISYPFRYSNDEWTDLGALTVAQYSDPLERLRTWSAGFVRSNPTDTLSLLKDLNAGIAQRVQYESREVEGTQTPHETLDRGLGSCRDLAVLFVEATRSLGFGARLVSGYLYDPNRHLLGSAEAGSTHAWAEVFIPGAGWITFDPTNRSVGGRNLIPVAVGRDIAQCTPVSGSFYGPTGSFLNMDVSVSVSS